MQMEADERLLLEARRPEEERLCWFPSTTPLRCRHNQAIRAPGREAKTPKNNNVLVKRKSNRLKAVARAGELIETFGRFISTRNCGSDSYNNVISGRYFRHVEAQQQQQQQQESLNRLHKQELAFSETYSLRRCCGYEQRNKTRRLISALLSDKHKNKSSLLISLLKAPIILAALFSLVLVATLIVFYALSFQQHNISKHEQNLFIVNSNNNKQIHHINGRDLNDDLNSLVELDLDDLDEDRNLSELHRNKQPDGLDRALTVQTECASFRGAPDGAGIVFKGIPFASPPIGSRRWQRPQPVWLDKQLCQVGRVVEARQWKSHCAQLSPVTRRFSGHEDCLYLDIYTPRLDQDKKLPVMVYIHGGFLTFGSSGQGGVNWLKGRPSAQLASELQVVMVAFNYRLQALGFMTLLQFSGKQQQASSISSAPDGIGQGNYGLWDQLVALNWIKRNIELFGGDPDNIVLFGPDSASAISLALLATGAAANEAAVSEPQQSQQQHLNVTSNGQSMSGSQIKPNAATQRSNEANQASELLESKAPVIDKDLFRAVWLTNPTVFHELPYELASQHYQRLFLNQSPCQLDEIGANTKSSTTNVAETITTTKSDLSRKSDDYGDKGDVTQADRFGVMRELHIKQHIVECLMNLSAEQVVRHYLGKDDASYRLDDQNSLPIHGIFADQFITVDRELVLRASYPFKASSLSSVSAHKVSTNFAEEPLAPIKSNPSKSNSNSEAPVLLNHNQPSDQLAQISDEAHYSSNNSKQTGASKQPAATASRFTSTTANYDDNCLGLICAPPPTIGKGPNRREIKGETEGGGGTKDLLIGSSAQAVEFWPCPRDLDQWNWIDFKRYVSTSLNSFSPETFINACQLYGITQLNSNLETTPLAINTSDISARHSNPMGPKETYLSMVSDIRQICPINELVKSLRSERHRVYRYIIETRPSQQDAIMLNNKSGGGGGHRQQSGRRKILSSSTTRNIVQEEENDENFRNRKPEYAYHTWDLFAFFGFHFDPTFRPTSRDLEFQANVRKMVKQFVHQHQQPKPFFESDTKFDFGDSKQGELSGQNYYYTLFGKDGSIIKQKSDEHRENECKMWQQNLDISYAWIS